jgi:hypothetical protein
MATKRKENPAPENSGTSGKFPSEGANKGLTSDAQTVFRVIKNRDEPYVMVRKALAEDSSLSWAARGLMGYLLGKPDDWRVRFGDLMKQGPSRRSALRRIVGELIAHGYMTRRRTREAGRFAWVVCVYEEPHQESGNDSG